MSIILSLININNDNVIVDKIINLTDKFINNIIFSLITGHCEITGNERADLLAKEKVNNPHQQHIWNINLDKDFKKISKANLKINS